MNSYNNKNHKNNVNNNYNKTNSTKLGFDLIVISLVKFLLGQIISLIGLVKVILKDKLVSYVSLDRLG